MELRVTIGQAIRKLREESKLSQEELAFRSDITYQYLSAIENGKENFTIGVLEAIAAGLKCDLFKLLSEAFLTKAGCHPPKVNRDYFRKGTPLPVLLKAGQIESALNETQRIIGLINSNLMASGARVLQSYIQGNNFSGLVSNLLCDSLTQCTSLNHNSHQTYPDLVGVDPKTKKTVGLEVKSTINIGKGGESHNGHSGWHLIACYQMNDKTGNILFVHVMVACLNAHNDKNPDWNYLGSKVNPETGSRRTETYTTNLSGTTKLRDGSIYLDPAHINFSKWRQIKREQDEVPSYSIFRR